MIENYLEREEEDPKPLIIVTDQNYPTKTLLIKWILYHKENFARNYPLQDIILPYFVTASEKKSNYVYAIFKFLMQLREKLNVKQKVELIEEKLRKYFKYWLDVCARKLEFSFFNKIKFFFL